MKNSGNHEEKYQATTVVKALDILKTIGAREMSASEICQALSMNKTTAHRLLQTLQNEHFIERDELTKQYRIGLQLVELCSSRLSDVEVVTESRPYLLELVKTIQHTVHLGVYSSGNAVYVDKIDILPRIRMYSQIGKAIPVYCSALGKSLLFSHTDEEILAILRQYGMHAFTQNTITEPDAYLDQIHTARLNGYSVDLGEHEEDVCCLAAPIYNYRGKIIAAISASGYRPEDMPQDGALTALLETSRKISRRLGYREPT